MYTKDQKLKAINLFYQYNRDNRAWVAVTRDLGYPSVGALKAWIKAYETDALSLNRLEKKTKFTTGQQKIATDYYFEHGQFIMKTIRALGYPSKQTLHKWLLADSHYDISLHVQKSPSTASKEAATTAIKTKAVAAIYERKQTVQEIANQYHVSRQTLYDWKADLLGDDFPAQSNELKDIVDPTTLDTVALCARVNELELQNDILRQVNYLLKKEQGINQLILTNAEKVQVINALRSKYLLKTLLSQLSLSKSSYFYQQHVFERGDKYASIRPRLKIIFKQNYASYGYRRMKLELADEGTQLSEKVIRRLMKEENLQVINRRYQKYSSYAGEISPAVPNLLRRDFNDNKPNQKWVTDITEFTIQAGKIYLSPIIDCFDGQIVSWTIVGIPMPS